MGHDKAWLQAGDETFLARICRIASQFATQIIVAAARGQKIPPLPPGTATVRDIEPDEGPLAGLLTGMRRMRDICPDVTHVWAGSCDAPFLNPDVVRHLLSRLNDYDAAIVLQDGQLHPLGSVYSMRVEPLLGRCFDDGERRLSEFTERLRARLVPAASLKPLDESLRFLHNINTPEEYKTVSAYLQTPRSPFGKT